MAVILYDVVDTGFDYEIGLIVWSLLQDFSKAKGSTLKFICSTHTAFHFVGQNCCVEIKLIMQTSHKN